MNFRSPLSYPIRAMVAAHSALFKLAQALVMKGAACSAVRHSSGNWAPEHEPDEVRMAWSAAALTLGPDPDPEPEPDPVPVAVAAGAAAVDVAAGTAAADVELCLGTRGQAAARPPRRRTEKCWRCMVVLRVGGGKDGITSFRGVSDNRSLEKERKNWLSQLFKKYKEEEDNERECVARGQRQHRPSKDHIRMIYILHSQRAPDKDSVALGLSADVKTHSASFDPR